jgi:ribonucleotide monophosphatase NagD (HAD superfamily)
MGKPAGRIYDAAKRVLPDCAGAGRILAVGDSLAHDVKGACAAGIDSLFVVHGIHKEELTPWSEDALRRLANEHCDGHMPTFIVDDFSW